MATKKVVSKKASSAGQDYSQMSDQELLDAYWNSLSVLDKAKVYGSAVPQMLPELAVGLVNPMGNAAEPLAEGMKPYLNQILASGMSRGAVPPVPQGNPVGKKYLNLSPQQDMALNVLNSGTNALSQTLPSAWYGGDILFKALQNAGDKTKQGITKADAIWQAIAYMPFGKIGKGVKGGSKKAVDLLKMLKP